MRRFLHLAAIVLLAHLMIGATGCQHTTDTVVLTEGLKATALSAAKDDQIKGLQQQVIAEQKARELANQQASLAAADFTTIQFASTHVEKGLPRDAIEEEAKLGLGRLPTPDPAEVIKGKDRVIAILQGEVAKAKSLYDEANGAAAQAKTAIETKDKEIAARDSELSNRDKMIVQLKVDADVERVAHAGDVKAALDEKDREIAEIKAEQSSREKRWLINATRIAALGLIVAGAIALAVLKMFDVGGGLVGAGVLVGLISVGIETLTSAPWWPMLCGVVFVLVVAIGLYGIYRLWVKHQLEEKKTQAIQDMRDEAATKGDTKAIDTLDQHLEYRMGQDGSFWQKQQLKTEAALGLVNPKGEMSLASQPPAPTT